MNPDQSGPRPFHRDTTQEAKNLTPLEQRALGLEVGEMADAAHKSTTAHPYLWLIEGGRKSREWTKVRV